MPPTTETLHRAHVGRVALWFGFTGGAVAWLAHFLLAYAISEFGCVAGWGQVQWAGLSGVTWALLIATLLTIGLAITSIFVAWRARQRLGSDQVQAPGEPGVQGSGQWMAYTGVIAGAVSLLIILVESIPIFYWLGEC